MELLELTENTKKIFEIEDIYCLKDKLKEIMLKNDEKYYIDFENLVKDLSIDWLQKIFQYYEADRKEKKQDYTPKCLAKLISKLTQADDEICIDLCCGSGALTIQKWNISKNTRFVCKELDENVIPFLLFNLAIRNIEAEVIRCDILQNKEYEKYKITKGEKYGKVVIINENINKQPTL